VDDAVVEIENLERHMDMGKTPLQAALDSSAEVGLAVIASAATIIAVFMPVAFMGGVPGQFFQPFGVTVAVSTIFSTIVARTVTPMMGVYLLKEKKVKSKKSSSRFYGFPFTFRIRFQPYRSLLKWALRHRLTTLAVAIAFFIGSLMLVPLIPKGFIDNGDLGLSTVSVELPPGSTLEETNKVVQQATGLLQQSPAVNSVLATIGSSGGTDAGGVNKATLSVQLKDKENRNLSQSQFEQQLRPQLFGIPGARISFQSQGAAGSSKDVTILLKSENPEALTNAADALLKEMRMVPGLVEVSSTASVVKPEILVIPDPARAADLGVTVQAIARTASLATLGDNEANLAKFNLPDRQIPIRVQIEPKAREDINTIRNLQVPGQNNTLVPLVSVADIRLGSGPNYLRSIHYPQE
jgi:multidrug efflux pump subunit AcrB